MHILVNGKPHQVEKDLRADQLLHLLNLSNKRVALEVNQEIIPKSTHALCILQAGDQIEIVHAIGGG